MLSIQRQDDWYTLVVEVKDVPAEGTLMIGDYIRSINGQALATPQEVYSLHINPLAQSPGQVKLDSTSENYKRICLKKQIFFSKFGYKNVG